MLARLLLFDVDQTLIFTAGAGMRAMSRAAMEVAGVDLASIRPDGRTDPLILRDGLRASGVPADRWRQVEEEVWLRYPGYLKEELARTDRSRGPKPGVEALLEALAAEPRAYLALLTGNLEVTARIKLSALGLDGYFPVGAFGSDCADRCRLAKVALERARRHYGVDFRPRQVWVIGDTPFDVEAARAVGARALAVATGRMSVARLEESMADATLEDLSDTAAVLALLLS